MKYKKIDLHFHSTASDGRLTPLELVLKAKSLNIDVLSLTDHDNTQANESMEKLCLENNIKFIPGVELSTRYNNESIHLLGYFKNNSYKNEEFSSKLESFRLGREKRAKEMLLKLKEYYNIELSYEDLYKEADGSIGRPHLAKLINQKYGYNIDEIFQKFIGDDSKAYIPSSKMSLEEGIDLLRKTECLIVLAHPGEYKTSLSEIISKFSLDGIECFYPTHSMEQISYYLDIAKSNNLFVTCGSDYHGILNDTIHAELGSVFFKEEYLEPFLSNFNI